MGHAGLLLLLLPRLWFIVAGHDIKHILTMHWVRVRWWCCAGFVQQFFFFGFLLQL